VRKAMMLVDTVQGKGSRGAGKHNEQQHNEEREQPWRPYHEVAHPPDQ
jgi:hypothetical protein